MWFERYFLLRLSCRRSGEESEVAFLQYIEVTAPSDMVDDIIGCNCMSGQPLTECMIGIVGMTCEVVVNAG